MWQAVWRRVTAVLPCDRPCDCRIAVWLSVLAVLPCCRVAVRVAVRVTCRVVVRVDFFFPGAIFIHLLLTARPHIFFYL